MGNPVFERIGVTGFARVGHFAGDEQFHLPLVIERRADLELGGGFRADAADEVF